MSEPVLPPILFWSRSLAAHPDASETFPGVVVDTASTHGVVLAALDGDDWHVVSAVPDDAVRLVAERPAAGDLDAVALVAHAIEESIGEFVSQRVDEQGGGFEADAAASARVCVEALVAAGWGLAPAVPQAPALDFDALVGAVLDARYQWIRAGDALDIALKTAAYLTERGAATITADGELIDVYRPLGRMRDVAHDRGLLTDERVDDPSLAMPRVPAGPALDRELAPLATPALTTARAWLLDAADGVVDDYRGTTRDMPQPVQRLARALADVRRELDALPADSAGAGQARVDLYLSGPMTGMADWNLPAFAAETARLESAGFRVLNPGRYGADAARPWSEYLRRDLADLVMCNAVAVLPGWEGSRGATLEVLVALRLGMAVRTVDDWIGGFERDVPEAGDRHELDAVRELIERARDAAAAAGDGLIREGLDQAVEIVREQAGRVRPIAKDGDADELLLVRDDERMSGRPTIGHSRLPAAVIATRLIGGATHDTIRESYPDVTDEQLRVLAGLLGDYRLVAKVADVEAIASWCDGIARKAEAQGWSDLALTAPVIARELRRAAVGDPLLNAGHGLDDAARDVVEYLAAAGKLRGSEPTAAEPWTATVSWTPQQNGGAVSLLDGRTPLFAILGSLAAGEIPEVVAADYGAQVESVRVLDVLRRELAERKADEPGTPEPEDGTAFFAAALAEHGRCTCAPGDHCVPTVSACAPARWAGAR